MGGRTAMKKLIGSIVIGILFFASTVFGAAFTSTQTGPWNDGATWGNDSPGIEGTDFPGAAGDTFTVAVGHTVTVGIEDTDALGASTINGTLSFSRSVNTKLTFGNVTLTVSTTGTLDMGTNISEIPAAYTCTLAFSRSGDGTSLVISDGGIFTAYGDSSYYGGDAVTYLADNAENTDGDATIITTEDMSASWSAGHVLYVQVKKTYVDSTPGNNVFGTATFVIDSISGTSITSTGTTITADASVGNAWTAVVLNLSRNVRIIDVGGSEVIDNEGTTRWGITDSNNSGAGMTMEDVEMIGPYMWSSTAGATRTFTNCTIRNGYIPFYTMASNTSWLGANAIAASLNQFMYFSADMTNITVSGYAVAMDYAINSGSNSTGPIALTNYHIYACANALYSLKGVIWTGGTLACNYTSASTVFSGLMVTDVDAWGNYQLFLNNRYTNVFRDCNFYENASTLFTFSSDADIYFYNCKFGWDAADTSRPNTVADDFSTASNTVTNIYLYNCKLESGETKFNVAYENNEAYSFKFFSEHHNQVLDAHFTQSGFLITEKVLCDGTGDRPTVDPDGGTGYALELREPQTNLKYPYLKQLVLRQRFWKAAGTYTVTYKLQTTYSTIADDDLYMICYYPSTASAGTVGYEDTMSDGAISTRSGTTDWTQTLSCGPMTVGQAGWVTVEIWMRAYEASDEVWIWPTPTWS